MRYTKELQANVQKDIGYGLTPQQCSEKWNVPVSVVIKWNNLEISAQRAAEIALRKYQAEVSETEAKITDAFADCISADLSDEDLFRAEDKVSKQLFKMIANVVTEERRLNPHEDRPSDTEIVIEITNRWKDNKFIKMYSV